MEVNREELNTPYSRLGLAMMYSGRLEESEKELDNAMKISEEYNAIQYQGWVWSHRSLRALLMDDPKDALETAKKSLKLAKEQQLHGFLPSSRDEIRDSLYIGASYIAMEKPEDAEEHLNFAITECRKINLVEFESVILLQLAKLAHLRGNSKESLKLATEALEIATRCDYVLQQADIEEFLFEYYLAKGEKDTAKEHLQKCIVHCTHCWRYYEDKPPKDVKVKKQEDKFYYIKKDEKWWYKPRYDKAKALLDTLS